MPGMSKLRRDKRIECRVSADLRERIDEECERRGQPFTEFAHRAFERELATVPSDTKGAFRSEQAGPAPVPSVAGSDGVRPAAPSQGVALETAPSGRGPGTPAAVSTPCGSGSVEETAPTEHSAQSRTQRPRRADIGPKPLSATKPRPKAKTGKGGKG